MNLREDKGWSYGANSFLQGARGTRPFMAYAQVQTDRTADSLAEMVREFEDIRKARMITSDERDQVIAGLVRALPGQFETASAVLGSLVTSARYGRPLDYASSLTERYEGLAVADLQSAANDLVHPQSVVWLIVGDVAKIRDSVAALNIAPVEFWTDEGQPVP
jgi:zinc protease